MFQNVAAALCHLPSLLTGDGSPVIRISPPPVIIIAAGRRQIVAMIRVWSKQQSIRSRGDVPQTVPDQRRSRFMAAAGGEAAMRDAPAASLPGYIA